MCVYMYACILYVYFISHKNKAYKINNINNQKKQAGKKILDFQGGNNLIHAQ